MTLQNNLHRSVNTPLQAQVIRLRSTASSLKEQARQARKQQITGPRIVEHPNARKSSPGDLSTTLTGMWKPCALFLQNGPANLSVQSAGFTGTRPSPFLRQTISHGDQFRSASTSRCVDARLAAPSGRRYIHREKRKANGSIDKVGSAQ